MKLKRPPTPLEKEARKGFRGYPLATIAYYGPNDKRASKVAVAIIEDENRSPASLERWFAEKDARFDRAIHKAIAAFVKSHQVRSVVIADRILGCPHEEGIDYAKGQPCPR